MPTSVPYSPIPTVEPHSGGGQPLSVRATPNDFGAQVSGQLEKTGNMFFDLAQKQQGMINETMMTNADADFATKVGSIKSQYTSLTGQAAFNAFPQYQEDIKSAFQETRSGLPSAAQRGFDMMATRTMANHIADGSSYASSQLKEAQRDSYASLSNVQLTALLDPSVAQDNERSKFHLDSLKFATQAQMDEDHPGLKTDPKTGAVNFDESTPEGQQAKAQFQQKLDSYLTQGYINRYNTLDKTIGSFAAYNQYQQDRDKMPRAAQVALDAAFAPKLFNSHVQTGTGMVLSYAEQEHAKLLYNPDTSKSAIDTVLKNEGGLSPDGHAIYGIDRYAHPEQYAQAQQITKDNGEEAGKDYARQFYKSEYFDKKKIAEIPIETQSIVMDGVINHSKAFGDKLIQAAKEGATPEQLIDMRRSEYKRLTTENSGKYGQYAEGWNNRLNNLQTGLSMEGKSKLYGANPDGSPLTAADYFRMHNQDVLAKGDAYAEQQMPGDLALKRAVRQSLENYMNKTISNESAQKMMDNKNIVRAINGDLTKGKIPETEEELRTIPGMSDLLDKVSVQDPKFAEGIPTMIAKMARRNDTSNSTNGYETIIRVLQPYDLNHPNGIYSQDHLAKLLGRSDGTGINMKDYNDAKENIESPDKWKAFLSKNMQEIANANGNVDGKGQQRAIEFYNAATELYQSKTKDKVPVPELINPQSKNYIGIAGNYMPARAQQIQNAAQNMRQDNIPTFTDKAQYDAAPSGTIYIRNGQQYRKP